MQSITSAVKLMDKRLVHIIINTKLTEITKRQEGSDGDVPQTGSLVGTKDLNASAYVCTSSISAPATLLRHCKAAVHLHIHQNCDDNPW